MRVESKRKAPNPCHPLVRNIQKLILLNADRQQIADGAIFVRGNTIDFAGPRLICRPIGRPRPIG